MAQKSSKKMYRKESLWMAVVIAGVFAAIVSGLAVRAVMIADADKNGVLATTNSRPGLVVNSNDVTGDVDADLAATLTTYNGDRPCLNTYRVYKATVLAMTADKSQALIGFGCGGIGVEHGIMVKSGDGWQKLGAPLFHIAGSVAGVEFGSPLDIPSCDIVAQYKLQSAVAPVCFVSDGAQYSYIKR